MNNAARTATVVPSILAAREIACRFGASNSSTVPVWESADRSTRIEANYLGYRIVRRSYRTVRVHSMEAAFAYLYPTPEESERWLAAQEAAEEAFWNN